MALPIADVLGILSDNLKKRRAVISLSGRQSTAWARGLDLNRGGDTVLYTGHMYQLVPLIDVMADRMASLENSPLKRFSGVGRLMNRFVDLSRFMALGGGDKQRYHNILRNIVHLLKNAGIDFGYLFDQELYTGALLYDEGVDDVFITHARFVYDRLMEHGVKRVITVDPHTTNMLRTVYADLVDGYTLKVITYIEALAEAKKPVSTSQGGQVVIHDSCIYARSEGVLEEPRALLTDAGFDVEEPELSGRLTHCCGGPLESLFPDKALEIGTRRVEQLASCGKRVVTMCPICMANLNRAARGKVEIVDLAECLLEKSHADRR